MATLGDVSLMTSGIASVLQQMQSLATQAADSASTMAGAGGAPGSFADELAASLRRVSASQQHALDQARAFELGQPGVGLNDVMVDMQKANVGFQMSLQVRNKLVSAYNTIMNLTV